MFEMVILFVRVLLGLHLHLFRSGAQQICKRGSTVRFDAVLDVESFFHLLPLPFSNGLHDSVANDELNANDSLPESPNDAMSFLESRLMAICYLVRVEG